MNKFYKYNLFYNADFGESWLVLDWWNSNDLGCPQYSINKSRTSLSPAEQLIYDEFLASPSLTGIDERSADILAQPPSTEPGA